MSLLREDPVFERFPHANAFLQGFEGVVVLEINLPSGIIPERFDPDKVFQSYRSGKLLGTTDRMRRECKLGLTRNYRDLRTGVETCVIIPREQVSIRTAGVDFIRDCMRG